MEGILHNDELPLAFQLLDQELLRNPESYKGVMDAYYKNVDLRRREKSNYGRGVAACEALMAFFLQSGDHDSSFVEALFPSTSSSSEPEPEMVSLTSLDVTGIAASYCTSLPFIAVGESRRLPSNH
jgi:hypothetical protein